MRITDYTHRLAECIHERREQRRFERAIEGAPTHASRQELLVLARR